MKDSRVGYMANDGLLNSVIQLKNKAFENFVKFPIELWKTASVFRTNISNTKWQQQLGR